MEFAALLAARTLFFLAGYASVFATTTTEGISQYILRFFLAVLVGLIMCPIADAVAKMKFK